MMTKELVKRIADDAAAALNAVAQKHGLDLEVRGGTYTDVQFTPKMIFKAREVAGVPREQAEFNDLCLLFGLMPEDYGRIIKRLGEDWALVGLKPSRPRFPILLRRVSDGKQLLYTWDVIAPLQARRVSKLTEVQLGEVR